MRFMLAKIEQSSGFFMLLQTLFQDFTCASQPVGRLCPPFALKP